MRVPDYWIVDYAGLKDTWIGETGNTKEKSRWCHRGQMVRTHVQMSTVR